MRPSLDHDLLRTFVTAAEVGNLTRAAERLRLAQPTISLQIKRLETALGVVLIERSPRHFRLTAEGETLLDYGRQILALADEAIGRLTAPAASGLVRLGTPEDFATVHLPGVLAAFVRAHPKVALEVTTDLTLNLIESFRSGDFDLVLIKREPMGPLDGEKVWREPLVWTCSPAQTAIVSRHDEPLPLVVSPHPCVYRKRAMKALDDEKRGWRVAYTSTSLAGAQAAVKAGLGVTVLPAGMVPTGFKVLDASHGLPTLADTEIALMIAKPTADAAERLAEHIVRSLEEHAPINQRQSAASASE